MIKAIIILIFLHFKTIYIIMQRYLILIIMIFITTRQLPFDVIQYTYNNYIDSSKISFFGFRLSKSFQELHILFSITFSKPHVPAGK